MIAAEAKMQNARPRSIDEQTEKRAKEAKSEKTRREPKRRQRKTAQVCAISPRLGAIRILLLLLHDHQQRSKPAYTH